MRLANSKTKKRLIILGVIVIISAGLWWFNTFTLKTKTIKIGDGRIRDEITLVQLSDLHGSEFGKDNKNLIARIDKANPDAVLITGDMWTRTADDGGRGIEIVISLLNALSAKYPVYVIDGGHDGHIRQLIAEGTIRARFLDYETARLTVGETTIAVHGIPNRHFSGFNTQSGNLADYFNVNPAEYNIVIAHEARLSRYAPLGADLSLCGHTHGGIVRLPFIGGIIYYGDSRAELELFPELRGRTHLYGLYESPDYDSKIYVSGGLGIYPVPLRFYNRPEVVVVQLSPA